MVGVIATGRTDDPNVNWVGRPARGVMKGTPGPSRNAEAAAPFKKVLLVILLPSLFPIGFLLSLDREFYAWKNWPPFILVFACANPRKRVFGRAADSWQRWEIEFRASIY